LWTPASEASTMRQRGTDREQLASQAPCYQRLPRWRFASQQYTSVRFNMTPSYLSTLVLEQLHSVAGEDLVWRTGQRAAVTYFVEVCVGVQHHGGRPSTVSVVGVLRVHPRVPRISGRSCLRLWVRIGYGLDTPADRPRRNIRGWLLDGSDGPLSVCPFHVEPPSGFGPLTGKLGGRNLDKPFRINRFARVSAPWNTLCFTRGAKLYRLVPEHGVFKTENTFRHARHSAVG
jgi:hypothetical protein